MPPYLLDRLRHACPTGRLRDRFSRRAAERRMEARLRPGRRSRPHVRGAHRRHRRLAGRDGGRARRGAAEARACRGCRARVTDRGRDARCVAQAPPCDQAQGDPAHGESQAASGGIMLRLPRKGARLFEGGSPPMDPPAPPAPPARGRGCAGCTAARSMTVAVGHLTPARLRNALRARDEFQPKPPGALDRPAPAGDRASRCTVGGVGRRLAVRIRGGAGEGRLLSERAGQARRASGGSAPERSRAASGAGKVPRPGGGMRLRGDRNAKHVRRPFHGRFRRCGRRPGPAGRGGPGRRPGSPPAGPCRRRRCRPPSRRCCFAG
ncbi:hypothetical protein SAMN05443573_10427 [Celeribacter indicus]|nr:hypothetical protein SAMN05443573_10427 [Celeribacter indicus]